MKLSIRLYLLRRLLRLRSRWIAFVHDLAWIPASIFLGYWVRFNFEPVPQGYIGGAILMAALAIPVQGAIFWHLGLYRGIWRFASVSDLVRIIKTVSLGTVTIFSLAFLHRRLEGIPRSLIFLYPVLLAMGLSVPRLAYRWFKDHRLRIREDDAKRTLVIGAGKAADTLVRELVKGGGNDLVGILDDAPRKKGRDIHGVPVLGRLDTLAETIATHGAELVLLAIPSASPQLIHRIYNTCRDLGVTFRTLPSLAEIADGRIEISSLREIRIEDLLGRKPVRLDTKEIAAFLGGKRILVTGAGGSIGSELTRQISRFRPAKIILLDSGEFNLYQIEKDLLASGMNCPCVSLLGDIRDRETLRHILARTPPEVVFHAAAYKHVPLVEKNPAEGVKTNVFGTKNMADMAMEAGVEKFVLVSTDKAVKPGNIMGATKRIAEIYCQNLNGRSKTRFITTRFGNVIGSSGSVVPLFREQIARGGPVTVTHPDMTRYFMTIPEACQLILQAGSIGEGGEIFVLDMGEPVKIAWLAEEMIRLSGLEAGRDVKIVYTGVRPGEKLHEELFHPSETYMATRHPKIRLASSRSTDWAWMTCLLEELETASARADTERLTHALRQLVPEYRMDLPHMGNPGLLEAPGTLH